MSCRISLLAPGIFASIHPIAFLRSSTCAAAFIAPRGAPGRDLSECGKFLKNCRGSGDAPRNAAARLCSYTTRQLLYFEGAMAGADIELRQKACCL